VRFVVLAFSVAVVIGIAMGGRPSRLASLTLRWPALAVAGIGLQFLPVAGSAGDVTVLVSFALLLAFAVANLRSPGFPLVLVGLVLNALVIAVNQGMPVTRGALVASDQLDTYGYLVRHGGAKHHLATEDDRLLFLGDVIPVPSPIHQALSIGDVVMFAGVGVYLIDGMTRTPREATKAPIAATPSP
jgi:hypothetical protein